MRTQKQFFSALIFILCAFLTPVKAANEMNSSAQQNERVIKGNVKSQDGEPIIGATVRVEGLKSAGTVTNVKGDFTITVPENASRLQFSYVGMKPLTVEIQNRSVINVVMTEESISLNEVVAIGYGTVKRKDITGSVASVSSDAIMNIPVSSPAEAISGKLAGVQVTTTEGSPDAEIRIRVRGGGSITGSNKPLLIVDGFPVQSIDDISPYDIESIDILKDASSTAIYGSRGANGVVIITTKSGKEGKIKVNYNFYAAAKKIAKTLDVLSPSDYAKWQYELALLKNDGDASSYEKYFGNYQDIDLYNNVPSNNWQDLVFGRTGTTFNHNLSINGGDSKNKFAFSFSHIDDKAIMQMSSFKRDNINFKYTTNPSKNVSMDFSTRYINTKISGGGMNEQKEVSSADSRLKYAMIYPPFPLKDLTSEAGTSDDTEIGNLYNPLVAISDNDRQQKRSDLNMAGDITWKAFDNFKLKVEFGYENYRAEDQRFYGTTTYYVKNIPSSENQGYPAAELTNTFLNTFRNTNTVSYDFKKFLGTSHHLDMLLGEEYIFNSQQTLTNTIHGYPKSFTSTNAFRLTSQGTPYTIDNYYSPDDILLSFFGRANYDYLSRYLMSVTFTADGSSKFSKGNKWGYFPSAALAWRISSEPFMESTQSWLDDLKLRLSYGTAGNNNIPSGQMTQSFDSKSTSWINNVASYWSPSKIMANPDLKWETTVTRNLGLDFVLLKSKLNGTIEGYYNTTSDLLINFPVPGTGYDTQYRNMGETQNKGVEFTLNWIAIDKKNYGLSFSGNIGFNKNKINSLGIMSDFGASSGWASTEIGNDYWIAAGGSVGQMYGYLSDGRYEVSDFEGYDSVKKKWILKEGVVDCSSVIGSDALRPGAMKLKDITNDSIVNSKDYTIIGNANPLHTGGFTINGRLYGFDLSANFNWSYGNDVYNANKIEYTSTSKYQYRNMLAIMADGKRWTNLKSDGTISNDPAELEAMNANTTMWSPYMSKYVFSDWAVEDGSFLRLNTLTLGYTLPAHVTKQIKIQQLRFYVTGYNLYCWTNYSGFDPEVSTRRKTELTPSVDYSAYPKSRQVVFGLNLNF
jgi:TonB-linked SusC/RagA family outer membrane protein